MEVFVAGGGVAGLSAAIALTKAGHHAVVAEKATELREIGAALSIWPNALAALDVLDMGEKLRATGFETPTAAIRSTAGRPIMCFDTESMRRALGGLPLVVLRSGLQAALLDECGRLGVETHLGETLEDVRLDGADVTVRTSGRQANFDAVIGADGINSEVRAAVFAGEAKRDCDRIAWRALIPGGNGLVSESWLTVGVGLQMIASPAPDGLVYWAADTPGGDWPVDGAADPLDTIKGRFGGWHCPIPQILDATPPDALIINRIFDRPPPQTLHRGPVLLVGDAAHAMTPDLGQGACQAIEDAAVLLACAQVGRSSRPSDLFETFERVRLRRVRRVVRDSYALGRLAVTPSRHTACARDLMTRLFPEPLSNRRLAAYASVNAFQRQLDAAW